MTLTENEKTVLRKVLNGMTECALFEGRYDAKNGNEHYMYGISAVLEYLYYLLSEEEHDEFERKFLKNMLDSETKI